MSYKKRKVQIGDSKRAPPLPVFKPRLNKSLEDYQNGMSTDRTHRSRLRTLDTEEIEKIKEEILEEERLKKEEKRRKYLELTKNSQSLIKRTSTIGVKSMNSSIGFSMVSDTSK